MMKNIQIFIDYENFYLTEKDFPSTESVNLKSLEELKELEDAAYFEVHLHIFNSLGQPIPTTHHLERFFLFNCSYIPILRIKPNTQNAVDLRLVREIGAVKQQYSESEFIILSRDKGFNSEIHDLNTKNNQQNNTYSRLENFTEIVQYLKQKYEIEKLKEDSQKKTRSAMKRQKELQNTEETRKKPETKTRTRVTPRVRIEQIEAPIETFDSQLKTFQKKSYQNSIQNSEFVNELIDEVKSYEVVPIPKSVSIKKIQVKSRKTPLNPKKFTQTTN